VNRLTSTTRATVNEQHRYTVRIPTLFNINAMWLLYLNRVAPVWLNSWIQCAHISILDRRYGLPALSRHTVHPWT
jgi:hypothetical protein